MFWKVLAIAGMAAALVAPSLYAQRQGPSSLPGCLYSSSTLTMTNLQTNVLLCDINGRLKVTTTP